MEYFANTPSILITNVGMKTFISSKNTSTNTVNLYTCQNQEIDSDQNLTKSSTSLKSNTPTSLAATSLEKSSASPAAQPAENLSWSSADEDTKEDLEKKIEELKAADAKLLEGVTEEELIFTVEEMTALGLDWKIPEEIADYLKKNYLLTYFLDGFCLLIDLCSLWIV